MTERAFRKKVGKNPFNIIRLCKLCKPLTPGEVAAKPTERAFRKKVGKEISINGFVQTILIIGRGD